MKTGEVIPHAEEARSIQPGDLGIGVLFRTIRDAAIVGDAATGRIALWNPAAERLFSYTAAEAVGQPLDMLVPASHRDAHRAGIARYIERGTGALVEAEAPVEVPALRKDGTSLTVELTLTPLSHRGRRNGAAPRYVLALIRDATERRRLAAEREAVLDAAQAAAARLEELATLKAAFTAMVAHELTNPIAAVRSLTQLLRSGSIPAADQPAILAAIAAEADLLARLAADIQTAAAVERDDFAVHPRPVPVALLVADAVTALKTLPGGDAIGSQIEEGALAAQVLADPERIGQVLRNLLGNAIKHTPPGTSVVLSARRDHNLIHFEVSDAGPGIPGDELERIFAKFGRGRDAEGNRRPGVGLGLYLSRRIARAHGSDLTVRSTPGEGTVFAFALEAAA